MTVNSTIRVAGPYSGTGSQQVYPFSFKVFQNTDILVVLTDLSGTVTTQALTSQYTVSLNADQNTNPGGTITMLTAPILNYKLTISSQVPQLQTTNFTNVGNFYPQAMDNSLDYLTILIQQLNTVANSALRFPLGDPGANVLLPSAVARANTVLGFDANGLPAAVVPASGSAASLALALVGASGASMIGYQPNGTGSVVSDVQTTLRGFFIDTVAVLRALVKGKNLYATTLGYYAKGDGGGGQYYYDSTDTTTADNGGTTIVATDGGRWKLMHAGTLSVKQFGAKGDNSFDDSIPCQACIDALVVRGGGTMLFPTGVYNFQSKRTAGLTPHAFEDPNLFFKDAKNIHVRGTGNSIVTNSVFPANQAEQMMFYRCSGITVEGITFQGNNTGLATATNNCGIGMLSCQGMTITRNTFQGFQGSYIASSWLFDSYIGGNVFAVSGGTGIDCAFWQDVRVVANTFTGSGTGSNSLGTTGFQCANDVPNVGNNETGIYFRTYTNHLTLALNRFSAFFTGASLMDLVDSTVSDNDFHNNFVTGTNPCTGLVVSNTLTGTIFKGLKIRDNTFTNNGSTSGGSGIAVGPGTAASVEVELNGNQIYDNGPVGMSITGAVVLRGSGNWFGNRITAQQTSNIAGLTSVITGSVFTANPGLNPIPAIGLAVPAGVGSANAVTNSRPFTATVYQSGGAGVHVISAAGVDTTLLPGTQNTIRVEPFGKIYFATTNTTGWTWVFD